MRRAALLLAVAVLSVCASQIFNMTISESLFFTNDIYVARIGSAVLFHMDYVNRMEYHIEVLNVIWGEDPPDEGVLCTYSMNLPSCIIDEEGNEIWESPLVTGSGTETTVSEGDTVIVFTSQVPGSSSGVMSVVRMEPLDSMDEILRLLEEEFSD